MVFILVKNECVRFFLNPTLFEQFPVNIKVIVTDDVIFLLFP